MARLWMIHFDDGATLTDEHCAPHEVNIMAELGYSPERITSVERVVGGRIITIKKSPLIENFFVATDASRDMSMSPGGGNLPVMIQKRMLGCYLKNSDPPIQCRLIMDAKNFDVLLECFRVRKKTAAGINARRTVPLKRGLKELHSKQLIDNMYSIQKTSVIERVFSTPNGLGCFFKKPKVRAEMVIRSGNVLLGFTPPDQKLKIVE